MSTLPSQLEAILATTVFITGANRPFGDLTPDDVRSRADELRAVAGWGPTARVGPVAMAWRELLNALQQANLEAVRELDSAKVVELAPKLWIVPPSGGLLG
jgi:hypothetical protein